MNDKELIEWLVDAIEEFKIARKEAAGKEGWSAEHERLHLAAGDVRRAVKALVEEES